MFIIFFHTTSLFLFLRKTKKKQSQNAEAIKIKGNDYIILYTLSSANQKEVNISFNIKISRGL